MSDFRLPDGRTLDDVEPQDMARTLASLFDRLSRMIASGGPADHERVEMSELMAHVGRLMQVWATLGRWEPMKVDRARKIAARLTDDDIESIRRTSADLATLVDKLRRLLARPGV